MKVIKEFLEVVRLCISRGPRRVAFAVRVSEDMWEQEQSRNREYAYAAINEVVEYLNQHEGIDVSLSDSLYEEFLENWFPHNSKEAFELLSQTTNVPTGALKRFNEFQEAWYAEMEASTAA